MTINDIDISAYHAFLLTKSIQPAKVEVYTDWMRQGSNPLFYGQHETYKEIKLSFLVRDENLNACVTDISNLATQLKHCVIKFDDLDYYYEAVPEEDAEATLIDFQNYQLDVSLQSGYAYLPAVAAALATQSQTVTAQGNLSSPAIVTLSPTQDVGAVTLTGLSKNAITVKNLHAGAPVTIDGEACTVTEPDFDKVMTPDMGAGKWMFRKYSTNIFSPDTINADYIPTKGIIPDAAAYMQQLITDAADLVYNIGYNYLGYLKTAVYVASAKSIPITFYHDDGCTLYLNNAAVYQMNHAQNLPDATAHATLNLTAGWNKIEFVWINHFGVDGLWHIAPIIGGQVDQLNAYYARDANPTGTVNKFPDTDMWQFPALQPGDQTVTTDTALATCGVGISYKPKFM